MNDFEQANPGWDKLEIAQKRLEQGCKLLL